MARFADEAAAIHPRLAPLAQEVVVTKRRVSAFTGSDLEWCFGRTEFRIGSWPGLRRAVWCFPPSVRRPIWTITWDGAIDADPEVHRVLMEQVFPRQADVTATEEWAVQLAQA